MVRNNTATHACTPKKKTFSEARGRETTLDTKPPILLYCYSSRKVSRLTPHASAAVFFSRAACACARQDGLTRRTLGPCFVFRGTQWSGPHCIQI